MNDATRIETIEIKLAHLERSLQELGETVLSQQRQIDSLVARGRALADRLDAIGETDAPDPGPFEKPPHY
jgi:SlyX protein